MDPIIMQAVRQTVKLDYVLLYRCTFMYFQSVAMFRLMHKLRNTVFEERSVISPTHFFFFHKLHSHLLHIRETNISLQLQEDSHTFNY